MKKKKLKKTIIFNYIKLVEAIKLTELKTYFKKEISEQWFYAMINLLEKENKIIKYKEKSWLHIKLK